MDPNDIRNSPEFRHASLVFRGYLWAAVIALTGVALVGDGKPDVGALAIAFGIVLAIGARMMAKETPGEAE